MKFLLMILVLLPLVSIEAEELTLADALRLAEKHSWRLEESTARRTAADHLLTAAKSAKWPTLSVSAHATHIDYVPSLELEIPNLPPISRSFGSNESYQTEVTLSLPIYTGGKISSGIRQAKCGLQYQAAVRESELLRLQWQTRLEYLTLWRSLRIRQAKTAAVARAGIISDDVRSRYDAGVADSVDLLQAKLSSVRAGLQLSQAETLLMSARIALADRLGLAAAEALPTLADLPEPPADFELSSAELWRPELTAVAAQVKRHAAAVTMTSSAHYPSLSVFSSYSYGKPNNDPFADDWNDNTTMGAQLRWSLGPGNQTAARKRASLSDLDAVRSNQNDMEQAFRRQSKLAAEEMKLAHQRYLDSRTEHDLSVESFRLAKARHLSGVLPSNRLLEIETALTLSEATAAAASVEFYMAQANYYYAIGDDQLSGGF